MRKIQEGRTALALAVLVGLGAACASGQAGAPATGTLHIVEHHALPPAGSAPTDIRWASDDSVFVSRANEGVFEIALDGKATVRRQPVADVYTSRFPGFFRLAVTPQHLVAGASDFAIVWRPAGKQASGSVTFTRQRVGIIHDLDLHGDTLFLLGQASHDREEYKRRSGVLWIGSLSANLDDLRPLLGDAGGRDMDESHLMLCTALKLGNVRRLVDGSFFAVPGFQPGGYLFSADGRRLRTWTSAELGIDSNCADIDLDQHRRFNDDPEFRRAWYARHRIVDDILPLPDGPGLLVRAVASDGKPRWTLRQLQPGGVTVYEVPLVGRHPLERMRGDVRQGRIVLLRTLDDLSNGMEELLQGEILVVELAPASPGPDAVRAPVP